MNKYGRFMISNILLRIFIEVLFTSTNNSCHWLHEARHTLFRPLHALSKLEPVSMNFLCHLRIHRRGSEIENFNTIY